MKKRVIAGLCAMALTVGLLAGCASKAPEKQESGKKETGQELKVAALGVDIKTVCIILADKLGYFQEEGVDVKFEKVLSISDANTAMSLGKIDVMPYGVIPSCTFISQGTDVVIIGGTISEGSEAIVAKGESKNYQKLEDLEGKKIGCFRSETGHMVLKGLLREKGINAEYIYTDSHASTGEAVAKGEVDIGFVNRGYGYTLQQGGATEVAFHVGDFSNDFPCCRQSVSRETLNTKRDELVKFQMAQLRAYDVYLNDHETTVKKLAEYCGQEESYVEAVIYGTDDYEAAMVISLDPNRKKVIDFYEVMKKNGDIDANTPYDVDDYIDTTIYKEALETLIERDGDNEVYKKLLEEYAVNNL